MVDIIVMKKSQIWLLPLFSAGVSDGQTIFVYTSHVVVYDYVMRSSEC
jgi:hypothetical protein